MGRQSARMYYQGKDHKDIWFNGHYHDRMYMGSRLVWKKIKEGLTEKYYIDNGWYNNRFFAQNGETALIAKYEIGENITVYRTKDFESLEEALVTETYTDSSQYVSWITSIQNTFFVLVGIGEGSILYSSVDAVNWEKTDTIYFDTNGYKGSFCMKGKKFPGTVNVVNNTAFLNIGKIYKAVDEYQILSEGNDYPHLIGGLYQSTDMINWKSVNTHFFMEEEVRNGKTVQYFYPLGTYRGSPFGYKEGKYYIAGRTIDTDSSYQEALSAFGEGKNMIYLTEDMTVLTQVSDETFPQYISSFPIFGNYFYIEGKGLTKDFLDFTDTVGFLDIPQETIAFTRGSVSYEFTYSVHEGDTTPFEKSVATENYIIAFLRLDSLEEKWTYGENSVTSTYKDAYAVIVLDKKDESRVLQVFPVFTPVYDYETKEITDMDFDYIGVTDKFMSIHDKDMACLSGYSMTSDAGRDGIVILKKEE